eukprot:6784511-Prymnesium_polylepis.1
MRSRGGAFVLVFDHHRARRGLRNPRPAHDRCCDVPRADAAAFAQWCSVSDRLSPGGHQARRLKRGRPRQ